MIEPLDFRRLRHYDNHNDEVLKSKFAHHRAKALKAKFNKTLLYFFYFLF